MNDVTTQEELIEQARSLIASEPDFIANAANLAAFIYMSMPQINWAGVYLMRDSGLVLGPFQGKPACTRIALGRGVCGTAAQNRETIVVPDVDAFPGHIACDSASRSEIVVPLVRADHLYGVLDTDSPIPNRFNDGDRVFLEALASLLMARST